VESFLVSLGLGELLARDALAVQAIILLSTVLLFVLSFAMMIMAARSAGGARRARGEAEAFLRNAQDVVVEARQLTAKMERNAAAGDRRSPGLRVSARETTDEAEIEILDLSHSDAVAARNLDVAKESAIVPKGLVRRSRRR
jgi:hypothetical protein